MGRDDVVKIRCNNGNRGTGVVVGPGRVATALHVVNEQDHQPPRFPEATLTFGKFLENSELQEIDVEACFVNAKWSLSEDWAVLSFDESKVPWSIRPKTARRLNDTETPEWQSYGFPDANPSNGAALSGRVQTGRAVHGGVRVLSLFSREAAAGNGYPIKGMSGAPVFVRGQVVGLLRSALTNQEPSDLVRVEGGTLFAVPIDRLPACELQWNEHAPTSAERPTSPQPDEPPNVFRVVVHPDPEGEGWLMTGAEFIRPAHREIARELGLVNVRAATQEALACEIIKLFNRASRVANNLRLAAAADTYVLHLAMPPEVASDPWEELGPRGRTLLKQQFLCITIDPIDDLRTLGRHLDRVDPHADIAEVWDTFELNALMVQAEGRGVLLAGQRAWAHPPGDLPLVLNALDQRVAGLVTDYATPEEAREALLPGGVASPWVDVLRRVKRLRLESRFLKVFWTDPRVSSLQAIAP